ncbi:MAG: heat-inducible transcriptional repressor HrcA [Acidobacteriota bacterium]
MAEPGTQVHSMPERLSPKTLNARDREVLRDVISMYILTGEPVGSRTVSKIERHGLSAASIRNVMADLEELGYLSHPHTSAGRVPTREGYHLFIQSLMEARALPARERRYIDESLRSVPPDPERLVAVTSHLLSELTNQASVVLAPAIGDTVLRSVEFVPLSERRVLCVVVSNSGFADSKAIDTERIVQREELQQISNYLTENFAGLTLREVRDRLLGMMGEERAQMNDLLKLAVTLASRGLDDQAPEVLIDGANMLLAKPEVSSLDRARRMLDTFSDKARLVEMLNRCIEGKGIRVFIGEDSALTSEFDFSLVATAYGGSDQVRGSMGILGPSRMEYSRIIPLVHYLGETLSEALASAAGEGDRQR